MIEREIVQIDRDLCNGCGECIPNCHEGALQMIDGKATLVSDLLCDGLGACIGHCPVGAITIEKREAQAYNEIAALKEMLPNGKNVVIAHLKHLKEHQQTEYLQEGVAYLKDIRSQLDFDLDKVINAVHPKESKAAFIPVLDSGHHHGGCPGSRSMEFTPAGASNEQVAPQASALGQWPVQMHLINPNASYFKKSDLLLAADCVAYALGDFHQKWLKGKSIAVACPKLDSNQEVYVNKLIQLINFAQVNTITVMKMTVPCCNGILQLAQMALQHSERKVPIKAVTVDVQGEVVSEEWI